MSANSLDEVRRSGDAHARREVLLTQLDSQLGNDGEEPCSSREVQVNVPAVQVVQKTFEYQQAKFTDKVMDIPLVHQRQMPIDMPSAVQHHIAMSQKVQSTHETPQLQFTDKIVHIPVVVQRRMPMETFQINMRMNEKEHLSQTEFVHMVLEGVWCQDKDGANQAKTEAKNGSEERLEFRVGDKEEKQQAAQDALEKNPLAENYEFDGIEEFVPGRSGVHEVIEMSGSLKGHLTAVSAIEVSKVGGMPVVTQVRGPTQKAERTVEIPKVQFIDKVVNIPMVMRRPVSTIQSPQKTVEVPRVQCIDKLVGDPTGHAKTGVHHSYCTG